MKSSAEFESMESAGAEQARRADYNHEWALRAERERDAERALADRLVTAVQNHEARETWATLKELNDALDCLRSSVAAWKEARSE